MKLRSTKVEVLIISLFAIAVLSAFQDLLSLRIDGIFLITICMGLLLMLNGSGTSRIKYDNLELKLGGPNAVNKKGK